MGNSPSGPRLLGNGKYSSYNIKLDNAATITVTKDQQKEFKLTYDVDGITCTVSISRTTGRSSDDECFKIYVIDFPESVILTISVTKEKKKAGLLCNVYQVFFTSEQKVKKRGESRRADVETQYWEYGCGTRISLLVMEKKKRSNEELPYMVKVAHYYVNSGSGGNFGGSGVDIGFSVVVKIGVMSHNGKLDFSVDGPVEHPSSALLYMIEEVTRTGTWKLSACPHCKNDQYKQRRWLSESEDSDTPMPPPPPRYGGSQNAANMGQFNGDGNGSIIQATKINFIKWWK